MIVHAFGVVKYVVVMKVVMFDEFL